MKRLRRLLPTVIINVILPFLIYLVVKNALHQPELFSLIATAVPSALDSIIRLALTRRVNFFAGAALLGIVFGLLSVLLSKNPKLLLIRESFFSAAFGLAFFISLLLPKPLTYYLARTLEAGEDVERQRRFATKWEEPLFRTHLRVQAVIWGVGVLVEAAVRIWLVASLTTEQFLAVSPFILWSIFAATLLVSRAWTYLSHRRQPAMWERLQEDA
ncbi:hypothetical protein EPA93_42080 [Ktedonosporobacter rubrisoli]|uniref:DUF3159 domain-containing protein n=1 Tax=Ktedonosporobacter rubrisoli TaxID=2509675 RepID=A0A4V0Z073_KTERU|nr:VC0807 family protein [Ktedonosporobacter rubrisoli]QBD82221.1 hypothetical protein EPA93_42080 [Ktedonosporobacter rubrisoli]